MRWQPAPASGTGAGAESTRRPASMVRITRVDRGSANFVNSAADEEGYPATGSRPTRQAIQQMDGYLVSEEGRIAMPLSLTIARSPWLQV